MPSSGRKESTLMVGVARLVADGEVGPVQVPNGNCLNAGLGRKKRKFFCIFYKFANWFIFQFIRAKSTTVALNHFLFDLKTIKATLYSIKYTMIN